MSQREVDVPAALPSPGSRRRTGGDYDLESAAAHRRDLESRVCEFWEEILGCDIVKADDSLADLGADSISALKVAFRIFTELGVELEVVDVIESQTAGALAARVRERLACGQTRLEVSPVVPSLPTPSTDRFPLSFAQEALWSNCNAFPDRWTFNMPLVLRLEGPLDISALRGAFAQVVARHAAFRTEFGREGNEPFQRIVARAELQIEVEELSEATPTQIAELLDAEERTPIPIGRAPLARARLLRLAPDLHLLSLTIHHVVFDGWSYAVLFREISAAYADLERGRTPRVLPLAPHMGRFATWQRGARAAALFERQLAYWESNLRGLEKPELEPDPDPDSTAPEAGRYRGFEIDAETTRALKSVAKASESHLFACLTGLLQTLIHHHTQREDVAIGTVIATRSDPIWESAVGMMVNALALRTSFARDPNLLELCEQTQEVVRDALRNQDVSFGHVIERCGADDFSGDNPFFQVMFVFLQPNVHLLQLPGVEVSKYREGYNIARGDLVLELEQWEGKLSGGFYYDPKRFRDAWVDARISEFARLAQAWSAARHSPSSQIWAEGVRNEDARPPR